MFLSSYRVVTAYLNQSNYWADKIKNTFGIECHTKEAEYDLDPIVMRQVYLILSDMGVKLVKACDVPDLYISFTMGKSCFRFPNHGYWNPNDKSVTLNVNIFYEPDETPDFISKNTGFFVSRPIQTLYHEFAHSADSAMGTNGVDLSSQPEWMELSGWSKTYKPGLKRLVIEEPGMPRVVGELYYEPSKAGFPRFYAARNNYDDFADCFAFYIAGLQDTLPKSKQNYFKKLLSKYSK
jgi:hypothetical protein